MSEGNDKVKDAPLNNRFFRGLDKLLGTTSEDPKASKIRGTVHAAYHRTLAWKDDNPRELERAKDQWNTAWGGPTDNLKKYDEDQKKIDENQKRIEEAKKKYSELNGPTTSGSYSNGCVCQ